MNSAADAVLLYVEDNPDHADLVLDTFSRQGMTAKIIHVEDGEAAIAYLQHADPRTAPRPRLILLDLRLPKIDGFEVLRTIKSTPSLSTIPVVVLTTSASDKDLARAYAQNVNSFIVKPCDLPSLASLLHVLSDYWLQRNAVPTGEQ